MTGLPTPERVLLVRTSALGDIAHCLPVLTALRRALPSARLGWVVEATYGPLLAGHPDLDELLPVSTRGWRRRPLAASTAGQVVRFARTLRRFRADVVLDLMGNHKAGVIAALAGTRQRVGLARRHRREPSSSLWIRHEVAPRGVHAVDRALSVLDALGLPEQPVDFGAQRILPTVGPASRQPYLLIHPGTAWENKRYPARLWGEVAALLHRKTGLEVRLSGGAGEAGLVEEVRAASGGCAERAPAASLPDLVGWLRGARLVLAGDTGPLHLAHALGVPTVCVLGPTDPERTGVYAAPRSNLWVSLPCSFCNRRLEGSRPCLQLIEPEAVAARAIEILTEN